MRAGAGRIAFATGFVVLLLDGAAAIWLGQLSGSTPLVVAGLGLLVAALALVAVYRHWMAALKEIAAARAELKGEVALLRDVLLAHRPPGRPKG